MPATRRRGRTDGCWTCKVRRKKCDELRPICGDCKSLEITCHHGPKPSWMDGGDRQQQMTTFIKNEIKRKAAYRREKAGTSSVAAHDATSHQFNIISNMMVFNKSLPAEPMKGAASGDQTWTPDSSSAPSPRPPPFPLLPYDDQRHCFSSGIEHSSAIETDFIMKFLDFVFPALFPFYRPVLFETGRSWLLLLLRKSRIAFHSTVSLSCYFFTMALSDAQIGDEYADCKLMRWKEVEEQTNKCFESLRADILALRLGSEGTTATNTERTEVMGSVVQVLVFESALGRAAPWNSHLPPACALLEQIMTSSGPSFQDQGRSKLVSVLLDLGPPLWSKEGLNCPIWSPVQAGFRFSAGLLIFIDIMASTVLRMVPRLLKYHADILAQVDDGNWVVSDAEVRLSSIVGCRNWVIRSIAEISALDSWKREQIQVNSLSIVELVERSLPIANGLGTGLFELQNSSVANPQPHINHRAPFDILANPSASFDSTHIWAHAAKLYLAVVVSGWQLSNMEIRSHVAQILTLLQSTPPYQLRALAWPLCVAGCLALESEETTFMTLFSSQGRVNMAGVLDDARKIMEQSWKIRTTIDVATWNLASCFSILGSPILLA